MRQDLLDLPTRDGVGASCVALPPGDWTRLLDFLAERFPGIARSEWTARMGRGDVLDAQGGKLAPDSAYQPLTRVYYYRDLPPEPLVPFEAEILYRDAHLIVVDKPHYLPVTPGGRYLQQTLLVRLKRATGIDSLAPVHRIDRETAGLVMFAVDPSTRDSYAALFRDRAVMKVYEAIAPLRPGLKLPLVHRSRLETGEPFMRMQQVTGEPNSETRISLIETLGSAGRYRLEPRTGRRHQLRAHMAALGLPIVNDQIYPVLQPELAPGAAPDYTRPLKLLAQSLEFTDPVTGEARHYESRLGLAF